MGARRAAGGAGRGRGQAGRPRDARGAAPGDGGADLHRAGRTGAGGRRLGRIWPAAPVPAPWPFPWPGRGWLPAIAADGKAVRGAAGEDGLIPYLLAAVTHGAGAVLAERLIGAKTNEVPEFAPLLRGLNEYYTLAGHVITADAGHTVRAHARLICGELLAHYVFTVKLNTRKLWEELDALDWASVPVQHATEEKGHGRRERRTIQAMNAPEHIRKRFPHARQVALIERYVTRTVRVKKGKRWVKKQVKSAVAVFIITSLDARRPPPSISPATSAASGRSRTRSIMSVTSLTVRTPPGSGPAPAPASWPPSVTSPSG